MSVTSHYNLPQWQEGENTDWFQLNGAFETIDTAMDENKNAAENAQVSADGAQTTANQNTTKISDLESDLTALESKEAQDVATLSGNIQANTTKTNQLETGFNNLSQEQTTLATTVSGHTTQLGGITLSYEEGDYYAQATNGVKKKLGENAIDLGILSPGSYNQIGNNVYRPVYNLQPKLANIGLWKQTYTEENFFINILNNTQNGSLQITNLSIQTQYEKQTGNLFVPIATSNNSNILIKVILYIGG